jgi:hypothetical protein
MSYSQKYTLVHFFTPLQDGSEFHMTDWPLHTTLADVFAIDRHETNIDAKLSALASRADVVNVVATDESALGVTPVVLLEKTSSLQQLHDSIVSLLEQSGAVFNNPEFTRDGFLPHSTIQSSGRLQIGDEIRIDSISLIDMFPNNDWQQRKVLATFNFK